MKKGFTLIELLVVIAIIAILSAILFPVFAKVREKARQISCASNEKQVGLGILQYVQDYDESFPQAFDSSWHNGWPTVVQPYIKDVNVFECPDDTNHTTAFTWAANGVATSIVGNSFMYWDYNGQHNGQNCLLGVFWPGDRSITPYNSGPVTLSVISQPTASIMCAESHNDTVIADPIYGGNSIYYGFGSVLLGQSWWDWRGISPQQIPDGHLAQAPYPAGPDGAVSTAHTGLSNFLFCDGHVKAMIPTQTNPDTSGFSPADPNNMWNVLR